MATFWDYPTKKIDLGDGNTVTVRKLTFADAQKVWDDESLYSGADETKPLRNVAAVVKLAICEWSGPGFEGRGVSKENIEALPLHVIDKIGGEAYAFCMLSETEKNESSADTKSE